MSDSNLLERLMPSYDAVRVEREAMAGGVDAAGRQCETPDFIRTPQGDSGRDDPAAAQHSVARHGSPPRLGRARREPPHQIAFGAIGRFWAGETRWEQIDADEFGSFAAPGLAKVASVVTLHACPEGGTLVTYECRALLRGQLRTTETTLKEASRHG